MDHSEGGSSIVQRLVWAVLPGASRQRGPLRLTNTIRSAPAGLSLCLPWLLGKNGGRRSIWSSASQTRLILPVSLRSPDRTTNPALAISVAARSIVMRPEEGRRGVRTSLDAANRAHGRVADAHVQVARDQASAHVSSMFSTPGFAPDRLAIGGEAMIGFYSSWYDGVGLITVR